MFVSSMRKTKNCYKRQHVFPTAVAEEAAGRYILKQFDFSLFEFYKYITLRKHLRIEKLWLPSVTVSRLWLLTFALLQRSSLRSET